jgi:hypothetical protein
MDLGFAHALALVAHGDAWLRAADDAPPPLPCLEITSLGCAMGPSFVPSGVREPLAGAEGLWYGWLRDRGAMRLRLTTAPWRTRRATKTDTPGSEVRLATEEGAALLVTYHDRHELWLPTWRRRPAARAWSPGCWAVTYKGRPKGIAPGVPGVPVSAAAAALGAAIASTRRDLRERGDERWNSMLEEAWDHLCASPPPPCRRLELLPTDGYGDGARRLLAAAVSTLEVSDDLQGWVMGVGDFYEDRSNLLHAIAISALVTATNAGDE